METWSLSSAPIIAARFRDADKARDFMEAKRWPEGPVCPHCGVIGEAYKLKQDLENKAAADIEDKAAPEAVGEKAESKE